MLTSKQRAYLRGLANPLESIFQVGKDGVGQNLIDQLREVLEKRELIKITILNSVEDDVRDVAHIVAEKCGAEVVQCIGKKFVLYKESRKNKVIDLKKLKQVK